MLQCHHHDPQLRICSKLKTQWNIGFHIPLSALAPAPTADTKIRQRVALLFHNVIRRRPESLHMQPMKVTGSTANHRFHIQAPMQRHHGKGGPSMAAVCLIRACCPDSTSTPRSNTSKIHVVPGTAKNSYPTKGQSPPLCFPPITAGLSGFSDRGG